MAGDTRAHIKAFTLVEIVITITVVSVFIASMAFMFYQTVSGLVFSSDNIKVLNLARLEMSKINNLAYGDASLADGYNNTTTNYEGSAYDLNRTVNYIAGTSSSLKKVEVTLYPTGTTDTLIVLATYAADVSFGPGSGGGLPGGGGGHAGFLAVAGGSISGKKLQNITLENTAAETITIVGATVTFSGGPGIKLKKIEMNGAERWSGNGNSGNLVTLDTSFALNAGTTYNNTAHFTFSKNVASVAITFQMSDGTTTVSYSWP